MQKKRLFFLFPIFLIFYEFCANISQDIYLPAIPQMTRELASSLNAMQLTITAWLAGSSSVQLFVGPLADRYGRRRVLIWGSGFFLVATFLCSLASTLSLLMIGRFLQGIGVCAIMVASYASVHDLFEEQKLLRLLSWMGSTAVIAPAVGPLLGGWLLECGSWRLIFSTLFVASLAAFSALLYLMPESASREFRLLRRPIAQIYKKIVENRNFSLAAGSFAFLYGGIIGWITASPHILIEYLGVSPVAFGWWQLPVFGGYILGALIVKPRMAHLKVTATMDMGFAFAALGAICFLVFPYFVPHHLVTFLLPMVCYSFGFGLAAAPLNRMTLTATQEKKGAAVALLYLQITLLGTVISLGLSLSKESIWVTSAMISLSILIASVLHIVHRIKREES